MQRIPPQQSNLPGTPTVVHSRRNVKGNAATRETAIIQRHGLTTIVHDLMGIATAMELRLDVVESHLLPADGAALRTLLHQLRELGDMVRLLNDPNGESTLTPNTRRPMDGWWTLVERLSHGMMPRGVQVSADCTKDAIPTSVARVLTHLWLLACEELSGRVALPTQLSISGSVTEGTDGRVELSATLPAHHITWARSGQSRWHRQALRIGAPMEAQLQWWTRDAQTAHWACSLPVRLS